MIRFEMIIRLFVAISIALASSGFATAQENGTTPPESVEGTKSEIPVIFGGRIAGDENSTRLLLDFDRELHIRTFYLQQPDRIVLDFSETAVNLPENDKFLPRGLISIARYGAIANGRTRFVLTLSNPAKITGQSFAKRKNGEGYRYALDLKKIGASEFANLIAPEDIASSESPPPAIRGDRLKRRTDKPDKILIMLDPGHGGIDGGASGQAGTFEKDLVLDFAKRFKQALEKEEIYEVLMTRETDVFLTLTQRLELSRRAEPDLFISVHADSLRQHFVRGSTIYTLSNKASDKLSEELANAENRVDLVAGLALPEEEEIVSDILADLTTRETRQLSKRFARILVANLKDRILLIKNPLRSAAFGVLKNPEAPGILLELGYLSNREDEALMSSSEWQEKVIAALVNSMNGYFASRVKN